jgi:Tectonin domain
MATTRRITTDEYQFALSIFQREFPPKDQIFISSGTGLGGALFVRPTINGNIRMHLGALSTRALTTPANKAYFAHELTHAWQIEHYGLPWYFREAIHNQLVEGRSSYEYVCDLHKTLGDYNAEQQGEIVRFYVLGMLGHADSVHDGRCEARILAKTLPSKTWLLLTGSDAVDVAVDSDATQYMVNTAGLIYQYANDDWKQLDGSDGLAIAANGGFVMLVNKAGLIYQRSRGRWKKLPGSDAVDIAVTADGNAFMVNSAGKIYAYHPSANQWSAMSGSDASRISAAGGEVWMVNRAGKIYRYASNSWTQMSGSSGQDITVSSEGNVFLTNHDGKIYSRGSNSWRQLDGSDGAAVSANAGRLVMVNKKGRLFSRTY